MSVPLKRYARPVIGLGITGFFVWLLMRSVDLAQIGASMSQVSPTAVLIAVACLAAGYSFRIVRWWLMLRALDPRVRLRSCVWPFLVSIALNNLLPFRAGDAVRVVGFRQQLQAPGMRLLGTLIVERLLDVLVLLTVFFIGVRGVPEDRVPATFVTIATVVAGTAVVGLATVVLLSPYLAQVVDWIAGRPLLARRGLGRSLRLHSGHLIDVLATLRSPALAVQLLAFSALGWLFEGGVYVSVARGLGVDATAGGPWFALATGTLATVLPSSPGYVGTFDYFVVLGLMAYGASRASAAAFAVTVHLVIWLPLTIAGLAYFARPGARLLLAGGGSPALPASEAHR